MKTVRSFLFISLVLLLVFPFGQVSSAQQSSADLISQINNARVSRGLTALVENNALNTAAQIQSDHLAEKYRSDLASVVDWHVGPNGEDDYIRALNAGYAFGPGWTVDEIAYGGIDSSTSNDALVWWLRSPVHTTALLNKDNVEVGAGITMGDGFAYYVVVFGVDLGSGASASGGVASTIPTTAVTPKVAPISVARENEDGSVFHTVESGEALWSIAIAYDITISQILALNNLKENAIIYEGQTLQVRAAFTPTPQPTETSTPVAPTRTPIPAQTAQAICTPAATAEAVNQGLLNLDNQTMGLTLILISGAGLVLIVIGNLAKEKAARKQKKD